MQGPQNQMTGKVLLPCPSRVNINFSLHFSWKLHPVRIAGRVAKKEANAQEVPRGTTALICLAFHKSLNFILTRHISHYVHEMSSEKLALTQPLTGSMTWGQIFNTLGLSFPPVNAVWNPLWGWYFVMEKITLLPSLLLVPWAIFLEFCSFPLFK